MDTLLHIHDRSCQSPMNVYIYISYSIYSIYVHIRLYIYVIYIFWSYVPHINKLFVTTVHHQPARPSLLAPTEKRLFGWPSSKGLFQAVGSWGSTKREIPMDCAGKVCRVMFMYFWCEVDTSWYDMLYVLLEWAKKPSYARSLLFTQWYTCSMRADSSA